MVIETRLIKSNIANDPIVLPLEYNPSEEPSDRTVML